ncbi:MAG: oxidoreductase [Deltaproteobacteria bacterium]|nr:oxidoreductase [Deltaproteobacteria bacterium]
MSKFGLLINYEFCVGCRSCEMACKMEHNRPQDQWGIRVRKAELGSSKGKTYYLPLPTEQCNLCGKRRARGLGPSCEKHCWTGVIRFGTIRELAKLMEGQPGSVLWVPH